MEIKFQKTAKTTLTNRIAELDQIITKMKSDLASDYLSEIKEKSVDFRLNRENRALQMEDIRDREAELKIVKEFLELV